MQFTCFQVELNKTLVYCEIDNVDSIESLDDSCSLLV